MGCWERRDEELAPFAWVLQDKVDGCPQRHSSCFPLLFFLVSLHRRRISSVHLSLFQNIHKDSVSLPSFEIRSYLNQTSSNTSSLKSSSLTTLLPQDFFCALHQSCRSSSDCSVSNASQPCVSAMQHSCIQHRLTATSAQPPKQPTS